MDYACKQKGRLNGKLEALLYLVATNRHHVVTTSYHVVTMEHSE